MIVIVHILLATLAGTVAGALAGCVPALHIYNIMAFATVTASRFAEGGVSPAPETVVPFMTGMTVAWTMANSIPSVLLAAPDESAILTVLPGQKLAMEGRGREAIMLTAAGGLVGLAVLVAVAGPLAAPVLPVAHAVLRDHYHWVLWVVIVFLLQSEWPKFGTEGQGGWRKFGSGWLSTGGGLIAFTLSGLLGFILRYRPVVAPEDSFNNLMPALVGLFAVPWLAQNIVSRARLPAQSADPLPRVNGRLLLRGAAAGTLGGAFAAFFPGITGGIGGLLAGHATAVRDDRVFLVSQGASKMTYYAGALLLFFLPGHNLVRGMGAWLSRGFHVHNTPHTAYVALSAALISVALSFVLTSALARGAARVVGVVDSRVVSGCALALSFTVVWAGAGLTGLAVMLVAAAIGAIPAVFQSRRANCLGIILLPMACGMSGVGGKVAQFLGLI